ncbi:hypothetical protein DEU56DRAFT_818012 [Suillus clintonianus]|uniref:uncharacterized protein n=1 Tax=Suillus clintonianus TaxID=1904413 RepID=UPI001B86BFBC|nr:uncharacterized protein DEU56DRAFT_818012 [Suillus clintonianus]KAG2129143.1 hypothetical protein DEU56DRAFT_818012 [Suillus clintonianus]
MSNASDSVVPQGSAHTTSFDPDVIADRGYMTTEETHYMVNAIAEASRRVNVNRADVNSLHVAAGRNAGDGDIEDPDSDSDSDSSGDEDEIPYHAARILMARSGVPPSRVEANIEFLRLFTSLPPSERDVIRAKLAADVEADESSTSRSTPHSTADADLVFRDENTKLVSLEDYHDIPRAVINLAKSKTHVPLILLTFDSMERIHAGDDISSFPPEDTLSLVEFHQASFNFIKLMSLVAEPAIVERFKQHRSFCLSHMMERYRTVLAFDMETRRIFFNTESFLAQDAYLRRWHAMDMDMMNLEVREAVEERAAAVEEAAKSGHSHGHRFHPYSKSDGNGCLCLICGRTGHKASGCTNAYTVHGDAVVCEWDGTLVLKSTSEVVCISFNIGRCAKDHERVHVCSICGCESHDAKLCC